MRREIRMMGEKGRKGFSSKCAKAVARSSVFLVGGRPLIKVIKIELHLRYTGSRDKEQIKEI